jgi:hypothetical protein
MTGGDILIDSLQAKASGRFSVFQDRRTSRSTMPFMAGARGLSIFLSAMSRRISFVGESEGWHEE